MQHADVVFKVENLNKSFTATKAVIDLSLDLYKGEIRGLIGENGSGKSTLASMIAGTLKPDSGRMFIKNSEPYSPASMLDGRAAGISILVQEMGTIDGLSVAENIFLGKEKNFIRNGLIKKTAMLSEAKKVLSSIDADDIDPACLIDEISFEDRKLLEVAVSLNDNPDILILDETTTALSQKGRDKIYSIIEKMRRDGKTIILISHDLLELKEQCDRITVLRDGSLVKTIEKDEISEDTMKRLMIGRDLTDSYYRADSECNYSDEVVLSAENISMGSVLHNISFDLHKGEILGIGGLTDCGMHELCKIVFGVIKPDSGSVKVTKTGDIIKNAETAIQNKIAYIPKNREQEALLLSGSIKDNVVLMSYDKIRRGAYISRKSEKVLAQKQADLLRIKMVSIEQLTMALSGGNKQKVVIGRWLANDSEILIMDCPTRGIDVGVKASIYELMDGLKKEGKSIIMVSEELPELIGMSDRILILREGRMSAVFNRSAELSEEKIIHEMI